MLIETIKRAVEIDAGVALLPAPTVVREVQAGTLVSVPLEGEGLVRPLGIIHRRGKELGATTQRFVDLLQSKAATIEPINGAARNDKHAKGTSGNGTAEAASATVRG